MCSSNPMQYGDSMRPESLIWALVDLHSGMTGRTVNRRRFIELTGASVAAAGLWTSTAAGTTGWRTAETPVETILHDVEYTVNDPYAVGGGGVVIRRTSDGWTKVLDGGPTGNGNTLRGSDTTDDREQLWFVGDSGAIGEYDVTTGNLNDYSAPNDVTNNFNGVAVTGVAGEANVYIAGDSGKMYYSFDNGETFDEVTPGSGSNVNAVDFYGERSGHIVDGNQTVFYTNDGASWDKLGIADANSNFYGVDSDGADDVTVSAGNGVVWNWNGGQWRREDTGDATLRDIEVEGTPGLTVGGGGKVFRRDGTGWQSEATPTGENLKAVLRGADSGYPYDIATGASGTVIEKAL